MGGVNPFKKQNGYCNRNWLIYLMFIAMFFSQLIYRGVGILEKSQKGELKIFLQKGGGGGGGGGG